MRQRFAIGTITLFFMMTLFAFPSTAQDATGDSQGTVIGRPTGDVDTSSGEAAAFTAYACTFDRNTNQVQIKTIMMDGDGKPVSSLDYLAVNVLNLSTNEVVQPFDVQREHVETRGPLKLLLVLDITDTVPIENIVANISDDLIPSLLEEDELSVMTFGEEVNPRSPFFSDKGRVLNDYIIGLQALDSQNQIYGAISQAELALETFEDDERRVILVLADSRRAVEQETLDAIQSRAQSAGIQIYVIGFNSGLNQPDADVLREIAYNTNGYSWFYEGGEEITKASIQREVAAYLKAFHEALKSEVHVNVLAPTLAEGGVVAYQLSVQLAGRTLTTTINCPVEQLNHSITFANDTLNYITKDPVVINVGVDTDLAEDAVRTRFWVNNEVVLTYPGIATQYTFDTVKVPPGQYEIQAQLLDENESVLAITENTVTIYAQQELRVQVTDGSLSRLDEPVSFRIQVADGIDISQLEVNLYAPTAENAEVQTLTSRLIATPTIIDGVGNVTIQNLQTEMQAQAPEDAITGDIFELWFEIPVTGAPDLADPWIIEIPYEKPPAPEPPPPEEPPTLWEQIYTFLRIPTVIFTLVTIALILLNILLFRWVNRLRVLKLIARPDGIELSETLMGVTVRVGDHQETVALTKKTMFVGRGEPNDVDLGEDEKLSRQFGVIMWRGGRWWYTNRKAHIVVTVDGRRIRGRRAIPLEPITEIRLPVGMMVYHFDSQQDVDSLFKTDAGEG